MANTKVFISYCHADKEAMNDFTSYRITLKREDLISVWIDEDIQSGEEWQKEIEQALVEATVAILFISENFLASDYIWKHELPELLTASQSGRLKVLPLFLSPSTVDQTEIPFKHPITGKKETIKLSAFQGYATPDKTLIELNEGERKNIFVKLAKRIRELAEESNSKDQQSASEASTAESEQFHRLDREKRYNQLLQLIAKSLESSGKVMDLFEKELLKKTGRKIAPQQNDRVMKLTKQIMSLDFELIVSILQTIYDELVSTMDSTGVDVIKQTSRLLIPWLFVASQGIDIEPWEQGIIGDIRTLPAGNISVAEIVFAGIDNREGAWKEIKDPLDFPGGRFSASLNQPESGPVESDEVNLRQDLFLSVKIPPESALLVVNKIDELIARRIKWLFQEGVRVYLIIWVPTNKLTLKYLAQVQRIQARYPALAIVTLDMNLVGEHQTLFDEIRKLLL